MLADKQQKPLRAVGNTVRVLGDINPPSLVVDLLFLGTKHPILDKFDETSFLADFDSFLRATRRKGNKSYDLNDLKGAAFNYARAAKKQRPDRAVEKVKQYLKKNDLKAVLFDKGAGYCLMTSDEYESRLNCILSGQQFDTLAPEKRPLVIRVEE